MQFWPTTKTCRGRPAHGIGYKAKKLFPAEQTYTRRQQAYADRFGLPYVFTPQMVIDGTWQGSGIERDKVEGQIAGRSSDKHEANVDLSVELAGRIRARIREANYAGEADVLLVRYDQEIVTKVTRGENVGLKLRSANVVRDMHPIAVWRGDELDLSLPLEDLGGTGEDFFAIIVQEPGQDKIIAAAYLDLRKARSR